MTLDRRRHDIPGRILRATFPVRESLDAFLSDFPCNVIGHRWVEVPEVLRRSLYRGQVREGRRMRFRCSRCFMTGGFSNTPPGEQS